MTLWIIDMDFLYQFNLRLVAPLFTVSFHEMFKKKVLRFSKVGRCLNLNLNLNKAAKGFSAFQRRSCLYIYIYIYIYIYT